MPTITLPTLHSDQVKALETPGRFKVIRCGRRWGKTLMSLSLACSYAAKGKPVGFFAPDYKILGETYEQMLDILEPIKKSANKNKYEIRTISGGSIEGWSLDNDRAGRSRKYALVIVDEAAFAPTGVNMEKVWGACIRPTLMDLKGSCLIISTPNGIGDWFWRICNDSKLGFVEYHAPTRHNPYIPPEEIDLFESSMHPYLAKQEIAAEFIDMSEGAWWEVDRMLNDDGTPIVAPEHCWNVYAVIDTAVRGGAEFDSTGVMYFATYPFAKENERQLVVLDWDLVNLDADLLEGYIPTVLDKLDYFAKELKAGRGSSGIHIESKQSGVVLIMQCQRRGWPVHEINTKLTSMGKSERAISVSGYVHRKMVGISRLAHEKTQEVKGVDINHFLSQLATFRVNDAEQRKRADDLVDCVSYGIALALGDGDGW